MMLLLLAGTREAREIAEVLAVENIPSIASLAGVTREPAELAIKTRRGGFGGRAGFEDFLSSAGISAVLDATHPFANRISARSYQVAEQLGIPYLQVLRPPWQLQKGDQWITVASEGQAANHINPGATVFIATGRQTLERYANLSECRLICRQIDPPDGDFPHPNGQFLVGRPPFSVAEEEALFNELGVNWLVVKNAGGEASRTKLTAARRLGIPVILIERPAATGAPVVETVTEALHWVRRIQWSDA